jgi:hypothetical protein
VKAAITDGTEITGEDLAGSTCAASRETRTHGWVAWAPLVVLPLAVMVFRNALAPWVFMWLLAAAIFAGCKWETWWDARAAGLARDGRRSVAYLLLWPGMDAKEFFKPREERRRIQPREWLTAAAKTLTGAALILAGARVVSSGHVMAAGWLGMIGLVMFLHFGTFQLIALAWQSAGIHAKPIMQRPLESESLSELWGKRWNLGFRKLSHTLVFRPLQSRYGAIGGTLGAFLASGLIHDLVISVPARGGYGLPTAYFLVQGLGVIAERSETGKRLGLGRGVRGWLWTVLIAAGPVFFLFHPWFVTRVMAPFLRAIGG